jgi:transposase-like protein
VEFKAEVVSACQRPGVSVAAVALQYQLNANLLRRWIKEAQASQTALRSKTILPNPAAGFIPVELPAQTHTVMDEIVIEVKRGAVTVTIRWPRAMAAECDNWLQGWLR